MLSNQHFLKNIFFVVLASAGLSSFALANNSITIYGPGGWKIEHPNAPASTKDIHLENIKYEHPRKRVGENPKVAIDLHESKYTDANKILENLFRTFFACETGGKKTIENGLKKISCSGELETAMRLAAVKGPDGKNLTKTQGLEAVALDNYVRPVFNKVLREHFNVKEYKCESLPNSPCTILYKAEAPLQNAMYPGEEDTKEGAGAKRSP